MKILKYHIFSGLRDKGGSWLDSVEGLETAIERIRQLSEKSPGRYYVFCAKTLQPLASIDTSNTKQDESRKIDSMGWKIGATHHPSAEYAKFK